MFIYKEMSDVNTICSKYSCTENKIDSNNRHQSCRENFTAIFGSICTKEDFIRSLRPQFLGVDDPVNIFHCLSYPQLVIEPRDAHGQVQGVRQCLHCLIVKDKRHFPQKHICGGCKAVVYCSKECQRNSWRNGHCIECSPDPVYKTAHLALDFCLKMVTTMNLRETLDHHMCRYGINANVFLLLRTSEQKYSLVPIKKRLVSCFPVSHELKTTLSSALLSGNKMRVVVITKTDAGVCVLHRDL